MKDRDRFGAPRICLLGSLVLFGVGELFFHGGDAGRQFLVVPGFARALGVLIDERQVDRLEIGDVVPAPDVTGSGTSGEKKPGAKREEGRVSSKAAGG